MLLFACLVTPYRIAFVDKDDYAWNVIDAVVDILFVVDMLLIFNTAYYDNHYKIIDNRKQIAISYLTSWFGIDAISIAPMEMFIKTSNANGLLRITRVGRIIKLIKLAKLLRVLKIVKNSSNIKLYL